MKLLLVDGFYDLLIDRSEDWFDGSELLVEIGRVETRLLHVEEKHREEID